MALAGTMQGSGKVGEAGLPRAHHLRRFVGDGAPASAQAGVATMTPEPLSSL
jgi:hypothetical protein